MRVLRAIAAVAALALALFAVTLALPVPVWRTGELPTPPLPLGSDAAAVSPSERLWVDTDAACGAGRRVDPDDCLALLLLLRAAPQRVAGISTVAGNADHDTVRRVTQDLLREAAARPPTRASLEAALEAGPLAVLALGPLTNIAAALERRPELLARVTRIVAVMGRRRGHLFHPSEGKGGGALFGHGPVFTDFNFEQDRRAAARLVALGVPLTFVPYEAARAVLLDEADLDRIAAADAAGAWVAARSRQWLSYWNDAIGLPGFYPFDLVAAAYVLAPGNFRCATVDAWITPADPPLSWVGFSDSLFVGLPQERPATVRAAATVTYCPGVDPGLRDWLMRRLGATPARRPSRP